MVKITDEKLIYRERRVYQAYRLLQVIFVVAPIIAGIDKFFYALANWSAYLSPMALQMVSGQHRGLMKIIGIIEILVGIGVIFKPKIFAFIVAVWLLIIILNLLSTGSYFDIAIRDFGLFLAAIALSRLSLNYDPNLRT